MTETKKTAAPEPAKAPLASAAASSDPAVHQLLAERQAHEMNKAAAEAVRDTDAASDAAQRLADVNKRLADLGYE